MCLNPRNLRAFLQRKRQNGSPKTGPQRENYTQVWTILRDWGLESVQPGHAKHIRFMYPYIPGQ